MNQAHHIGWVAALVYCVACCLRLARFNVMLDNTDVPQWQKSYFVGVPAPAGAFTPFIAYLFRYSWFGPQLGWALFLVFIQSLLLFF